MKTFWREYKTTLLFILLMCLFRSALADWNHVPTGSMKPSILEGDQIGINKIAYDLRLPFTHISLIHLADPERGDVVVFDSKAADKRLVKRVIGLPGDTIAMRDDHLIINGQPLAYSATSDGDWLEQLPGKTHKVRLQLPAGSYANFGPLTVPAGHYLMLGDNRDNSADSRVIGFVPRTEIVGRSRSVVFSLNYNNHFLPRSQRFFHELK